ncbi:MAG TPA: BON domain-containing protein, partial [Gemmatimonadaceae bacterium]|nr:BON domain-containing protein [Gemmatimonadaceae bacterium]
MAAAFEAPLGSSDPEVEEMKMNGFIGSGMLLIPVSLAVGAGALIGCRREPALSHAGVSAASVAPTVPKSQAPPLADADIARAIRKQFDEDRLLHSERVEVAVSHGVASLSGSVSNLLAKNRARPVAETIKGVRSVIDLITLSPVARTDAVIKSDVENALRDDAATRGRPIGVLVKDAKVTLSGTADSWQQKRLFDNVAEAVPGVKGIQNEITIHYSVDRSDSQIVADVNNRLQDDLWLDGDSLHVAAAGHTVHLDGVVGSAAQKTRAYADGWVAGVDAVDDTRVTIDWDRAHDQKGLHDYPVKSDAEILKAVRDAFQLDPRLATLLPQASLQDGTITLMGVVSDANARRAAEEDADDTVGVWKVRDETLVAPGGKPTDADIAKAVKRALRDDVLVPSAKSIQVSSTNGKIALSGIVASSFERNTVLADVNRVSGVAEIDDQ